MTVTVITEDMRGAVGSELNRSVSFPISPSDIRKWAIAVYYPEDPPAYFWDAEAAGATEWGGIVAPEDFNPFAWMSATPKGLPASDGVGDADHTEHQLGLTGTGLHHQLNGGITATYGARMRPGDVITSVTRLADYSEREGRLGLMLMTVFEDTWTNQRDELVKVTRMTLIRY